MGGDLTRKGTILLFPSALFEKISICCHLKPTRKFGFRSNRTRPGSQILPTSGQIRAGYIWPVLLFCIHAKWSAGACLHRWRRSWFWMRCRWRSYDAVQKEVCYITRIAAVSIAAKRISEPLRSTGFNAAWVARETVGTMRWWRASLRRSRKSWFIARNTKHGHQPGTASSSISKCSTIVRGFVHLWAIRVPKCLSKRYNLNLAPLFLGNIIANFSLHTQVCKRLVSFISQLSKLVNSKFED